MTNCVNKSEGHQELIHGFQNFGKNGSEGRQSDREVVKNTEYENRTLIYLSRTVFFISFYLSWTKKQPFSNKRLGMERTKTRLQSVTFHFRE